MNLIKIAGVTMNLDRLLYTHEGNGSYVDPRTGDACHGRYLGLVFGAGVTIGFDGEDAEILRAHLRAAASILVPVTNDVAKLPERFTVPERHQPRAPGEAKS